MIGHGGNGEHNRIELEFVRCTREGCCWHGRRRLVWMLESGAPRDADWQVSYGPCPRCGADVAPVAVVEGRRRAVWQDRAQGALGAQGREGARR